MEIILKFEINNKINRGKNNNNKKKILVANPIIVININSPSHLALYISYILRLSFSKSLVHLFRLASFFLFPLEKKSIIFVISLAQIKSHNIYIYINIYEN